MPVVNDYTALLSGSYWAGIEVVGTPVIVTYSFTTAATVPDYPVEGFTEATAATFQEFSDAEKAQARTALAEWAAASSLVFLEVDPGHGDINFQLVDFSTTAYGGAAGIGFYPFGSWNFFSYPYFSDDLDVAGDIFMNSDFETGSGPGEAVNYATLLHEIGHAIGLKHPTETFTNLAAQPTPVVHDQVLASDDPDLTIMASVGGANEHLTTLDKQAAAHIYGPAGKGGVFQADASGNNSKLASWIWDADTETLTLNGKGVDDAIRGSSVTDIIKSVGGNDKLFGLDGNDTLDGGIGNDSLDGGEGVDTMWGRTGDDIYFVDNAGDLVQEAFNQGNDWVYASSSYTLANNVEGVQFFGQNVVGYGNNSANTIYGDGSNATTLYGKNGDDYMVGGSANDFLRGGNNDDTIFGLDGADNIGGDAGDDYLMGGGGNDKILGGAGADTITGGAGRDNLTGGTGSDWFVFDTAPALSNIDTIVDYNVTDDAVAFMQSAFANLDIGAGSTLAESNFTIGTAATTGDHHLIYDSVAGKLMYDADGAGGAAQQTVATLTAGLALTYQDFFVFT